MIIKDKNNQEYRVLWSQKDPRRKEKLFQAAMASGLHLNFGAFNYLRPEQISIIGLATDRKTNQPASVCIMTYEPVMLAKYNIGCFTAPCFRCLGIGSKLSRIILAKSGQKCCAQTRGKERFFNKVIV